MTMQLSWSKGLLVQGKNKIAVDCNADTSIVTHAHADHASFRPKGLLLGSKATFDLIGFTTKTKKSLDFGERFRIDDLTISLHNAGHILGSSQVLIEGDERIAITSDFKLQDSLILEGAKPLQCDKLVIETTYGLPQYSFPDRTSVYEKFASWAKKQLSMGKFLVLAGYAIGKAQELTAFSNKYLNIAPLVHEKIYQNNKIYEEHNIKLGPYYKLDHNLHDSDVLILPHSLCNAHLVQAISFSVGKKVASAKASGWPYLGFYDAVFPLSDHADFNQLLEYVKAAEPKQVFTMHGFAKEFAAHIRRRYGITARPLEKGQQSFLIEFD